MFARTNHNPQRRTRSSASLLLLLLLLSSLPLPHSPQNFRSLLVSSRADARWVRAPTPKGGAMATAGVAVANGSGGADTKAAFKEIYSTLKEEMLEDPAFEFTDESLQWIDRVMLSSSA